jgi:hypothetical protein
MLAVKTTTMTPEVPYEKGMLAVKTTTMTPEVPACPRLEERSEDIKGVAQFEPDSA